MSISREEDGKVKGKNFKLGNLSRSKNIGYPSRDRIFGWKILDEKSNEKRKLIDLSF